MTDIKKRYVKITRHDKSVHFAPVTAKRKLVEQNTLQKAGRKMRIEDIELTDAELKAYPAFDYDYVPAGENNHVAMLKKLAASKEIENEELRNRIAELEKGQANPVKTNATPTPTKAAELIALIEIADSEKEIIELIGDDTRVSVTNAATKRVKELNEKNRL